MVEKQRTGYAPTFTTVKMWAAKFKWGRDSKEDNNRSGQPKTTTTDKPDMIIRIVLQDRRVTLHQYVKPIGITSVSVNTVLTERSWGWASYLQDGFQVY